MTDKPRQPRRDNRADWRLLRPTHHGNTRPATLLPEGGPGGRKGTPNDHPADR